MTNKLALLLGVLSACAITTSNAMEEKTDRQRSVTVDDVFLGEHHEAFKASIQNMSVQKKVVEAVLWIPGGKSLIQMGAEFAGYADEIGDLPFLDRLFADEAQRTRTIDSLKTDPTYQDLASEYLSNVFDALDQKSVKDRKTFLALLHAQNIKTLGQPASTTRKRLCELAKERSKDGQPIIPDERYFEATTLSLLTVHIYEKRSQQSSDKN